MTTLDKFISIQETPLKQAYLQSSTFNPGSESTKPSICALTNTERQDAATLIHNTTATPFMFGGFSYRCFYCNEFFTESQDLRQHTSQHGIKNRKLFLEKYINENKRTIYVDITRLKCRLCNTNTYPSLNAVKEHLKSNHGKEFCDGKNGLMEFNMEVVKGKLHCHICDANFQEFRALKNHMNTHYPTVVCEYCGESFFERRVLKVHKDATHKRTFKCKMCDEIFVKIGQLTYHLYKKHKKRPKTNKCSKCEMTFKYYYNKMRHMIEVHGISNKFQCHACNAQFEMKRTLTEHFTREHTQKYKCETCSKCFGIESKLKQHVLGHSRKLST